MYRDAGGGVEECDDLRFEKVNKSTISIKNYFSGTWKKASKKISFFD